MCFPPRHPLDRGLEPGKRAFLNSSRDLGTHTRIHHTLMHNDRATRLLDTGKHHVAVPRVNGSEIDKLDAATEVSFRGGNGGAAGVERGAVGDDGEVGAGFEDFGGVEGEGVGAYWDLFDGGAVEDFGLHEDGGVWGGDGGEEEAFGLDGGAGDDDAETGGVGEEGFGGLGVVERAVSDTARWHADN